MKRLGMRALLAAGATIGGLVALAPTAQAQATRTWISGVGDDVNPCSRTAPCRTAAGAISKTAAGGEINCLDPMAIGTVTITKAITIDCLQFPGGMLNTGTNGVTINAGVTDAVVIRGIEITGVAISGSGSNGVNGIRVLQAGSVTIERVIVRGQSGGGLLIANGSHVEVAVNDSTFTSSGSPGTTSGGGIVVTPSGAGTVQLTLRNTRAVNNFYNGLVVDTGGSSAASGAVVVDIAADSGSISGNINGVQVNTPAAIARIVLANLSIANNNRGIAVLTANSAVYVGSTSITGSNRGLQVNGVPAAGSGLISYGNNVLAGNNTDGSFTATTTLQ